MSEILQVNDGGFSSRTLLPVFTPNTTLPDTWVLTVLAATGGTTDLVGAQTEDVGATISVRATAAENYAFTSWLLDNADAGSTNPISVADGSNTSRTLQPVFTYTQSPTASMAGVCIPNIAGQVIAGFTRAGVFWCIFDNELMPALIAKAASLPTFEEIKNRLAEKY